MILARQLAPRSRDFALFALTGSLLSVVYRLSPGFEFVHPRVHRSNDRFRRHERQYIVEFDDLGREF